MNIKVDIDGQSGFCKGVIRAITTAEKSLGKGDSLFSLGSIVHNDVELSRLEGLGLVSIDRGDLDSLGGGPGAKILIRAHGEPPETYEKIRELDFEAIDCTCPVVLSLQRNILEAYKAVKARGGAVLIFGKVGHAEVMGLVGQVGGDALVVEDMAALETAVEEGKINTGKPIEVFSQTTKSPSEYEEICSRIMEIMESSDLVTVHNTICAQVASRHKVLSDFAISHDVIIFVAGKSSSNGKVLCELCAGLNTRTHHIESPSDLKREWFGENDKVGVCGATSTPKWLLEEVAEDILEYNK